MTDITEHKWSDKGIEVITLPDERMLIDGVINKSDAIAIAKHFGLVDFEAMNEFARWAEDRRQDFPKCTEALEAFIFMKANMVKG